jgi:hypothetical protein
MFFMLISEDFNCSTWPSSSATQQSAAGQTTSRPPITTRQVQRRTFVIVAEALILPHQVIALCLQLLDIIVILGKGGVEIGLHGGRVLPRLQKLLFQCFSPEHRVTKALQHVGLIAGPRRNVLHRQLMSHEYSTTED